MGFTKLSGFKAVAPHLSLTRSRPPARINSHWTFPSNEHELLRTHSNDGDDKPTYPLNRFEIQDCSLRGDHNEMSETEGARRAKTGERTQILNTHSRSKSYRSARTSTPFISVVCEKGVRPWNHRKTRFSKTHRCLDICQTPVMRTF